MAWRVEEEGPDAGFDGPGGGGGGPRGGTPRGGGEGGSGPLQPTNARDGPAFGDGEGIVCAAFPGTVLDDARALVVPAG